MQIANVRIYANIRIHSQFSFAFICMLRFQRFRIKGMSMSPAFQPGDRVAVVRRALYRAGDVVALNDSRSGKVLLKRVCGRTEHGYFVEGDNKSQSTDSRVFGAVATVAILGKVFATY